MTSCAAVARDSFLYLETSIPEGQTIAEYRRSRPTRRRWFRIIRRESRGAATTR
jgi:hypothetical protein